MKRKLSTFIIAAIYIGTIVGAGFATGQEILQFFGYFGRWGIAGLILSTGMFVVFGISLFELGQRLQAKSHLAVVRHVGGRWIGTTIDLIITFFLFGALTTMAAGSGAVFAEEFGVAHLWGSLAMVTLTSLTVLLGLKGVISAVSFVVPFLLAAVLGVSSGAIILQYDTLLVNLGTYIQAQRAPVPLWPLSALLYVSYNLVLAVPIMGPLGTMASTRNLRLGAILGGIGLGSAALAINLSLLANIPTALRYEVPLLFVAGGISPLLRLAFSMVLLAEIYTTAVTSLYGFTARVFDPAGASFRRGVVGVGLISFAAAQFGFPNSTLFPAVGAAGLILLGTLAYGILGNRSKSRHLRRFPLARKQLELQPAETAEELTPEANGTGPKKNEYDTQ